MSSFRLDKVGNQVSQIISELIIRSEIKDHRVTGMLSITSVELSRDLAYAKLSVSGFMDEVQLRSAVEGLNSASGFIQRILGKKLRTRNTPKLRFIADTGIAEGIELNRKIKELGDNEWH